MYTFFSPARLFSFVLLFYFSFSVLTVWSEAPDPDLTAVTNAFDSLLKLTDGAVSFQNYQKKLQETEATVQKSQAALNDEQKALIEKSLGYLRTARDVMQWRMKRRDKDGNYQYSESDKDLNGWFVTYPFLRSAIMEKAPAGGTGLYDPDTALTFLWDRAEQVVEELKGEKKEEP